MHELIRQYAAGKLAQQPAEEEAVAQRHGRYFADFLAAREEAIQGTNYLQAKEEIGTDVDNIRKVWEWAVATRDLEIIARSVETLHHYFLNTQGLFGEAAQRFQHAATQIAGYATGDEEPLVGRLQLKAAANRRMLGQLEEGSHLLEESLSHFYRHELEVDIARATSTLGVVRLQQNEKEKGLRLAKTAVAQEIEMPTLTQNALALRARLLSAEGENGDAVSIRD